MLLSEDVVLRCHRNYQSGGLVSDIGYTLQIFTTGCKFNISIPTQFANEVWLETPFNMVLAKLRLGIKTSKMLSGGNAEIGCYKTGKGMKQISVSEQNINPYSILLIVPILILL